MRRDIRRILSRSLWGIFFLLLLPALGACDSSDALEPAVEEPDVKVQKETIIGHLTVGTIAYSSCPSPPFWPGGKEPQQDSVLLDLYQGRAAFGPDDGPTDEEIEAVERHGRVVQAFSVPVIRAVLPVAAVPIVVWNEDLANHARWIPDPDEFNVPVSVETAPPPLQDSAASVFERLGGVVGTRYSWGGFSGAAPDSVLAEIWTHFEDGLGNIQPSTVYCLL